MGGAVGIHFADGIGESGVLHIGADEEIGHQVSGQGGVLGQRIADEADDVGAVTRRGEGIASPQVRAGAAVEHTLAALSALGVRGVIDIADGVGVLCLTVGEQIGSAVGLCGFRGEVIGALSVVFQGEAVQMHPCIVAHHVGVHAGGGTLPLTMML